MNAVNLIPSDRRKRQVGVSVSPLTLGVIGGLIVVLAAAVLYVATVNNVRARKSELATVTANAASWQAAANSYASYMTAAQQQKQQLTDVGQLVTGRFPWSLLLSQIGGVLPSDAALTSLQATSPSADSTSAAAASTGTATSSTTTTQAVQITGCAATESAVAATMVALGRVHGVGSVSLASTSNTASSSSGSAPAASGSSGGSSSSAGCGYPVNFSLSLNLASPASSTASSGTTTPASSTPPAATPTASSTATPSTGSAQ